MSDAASKIRVWIIERDYLPYTEDGKVISFAIGSVGTESMKRFLNNMQASRSGHYWDAAVYARLP